MYSQPPPNMFVNGNPNSAGTSTAHCATPVPMPPPDYNATSVATNSAGPVPTSTMSTGSVPTAAMSGMFPPGPGPMQSHGMYATPPVHIGTMYPGYNSGHGPAAGPMFPELQNGFMPFRGWMPYGHGGGMGYSPAPQQPSPPCYVYNITNVNNNDSGERAAKQRSASASTSAERPTSKGGSEGVNKVSALAKHDREEETDEEENDNDDLSDLLPIRKRVKIHRPAIKDLEDEESVDDPKPNVSQKYPWEKKRQQLALPWHSTAEPQVDKEEDYLSDCFEPARTTKKKKTARQCNVSRGRGNVRNRATKRLTKHPQFSVTPPVNLLEVGGAASSMISQSNSLPIVDFVEEIEPKSSPDSDGAPKINVLNETPIVISDDESLPSTESKICTICLDEIKEEAGLLIPCRCSCFACVVEWVALAGSCHWCNKKANNVIGVPP